MMFGFCAAPLSHRPPSVSDWPAPGAPVARAGKSARTPPFALPSVSGGNNPARRSPRSCPGTGRKIRLPTLPRSPSAVEPDFTTAMSLAVLPARRAEWQWSVPMGNGRAFLWIPPHCKQVRAVVVGQNNMIEQGILEHPAFRQTLADENIAEVFVAPPFDFPFRLDKDAGQRLNDVMKPLAAVSGYSELELAAVVPLGHSAGASFPWNFAAWNPGRALAVWSVHGDSPPTKLPGSRRPNPDWGDRSIDGIPGLIVMGEYELMDARMTPSLDY